MIVWKFDVRVVRVVELAAQAFKITYMLFVLLLMDVISVTAVLIVQNHFKH